MGLHRALRAGTPSSAISEQSIQATSPDKTQHTSLAPLIELLEPRGFLLATLSYVGYGLGYIIYLTFFVALIVRQGLPLLLVGLVWAAMGVAGAISGLLWGRAIDRWPTGFTLAVTLGLGALGASTVLTQKLTVEAMGAALFGISVFLGPPLIVTFLLRRAVSGEQYPSSYSFLNTLFGIGQIIGPLLGGVVVDHLGLAPGTALTAVILCGAALLAMGYGIVQQHR